VHNESWVVFSDVDLPDVKDDGAFLKALEQYREQLLHP
jgi:hypothetical protein